MTSSPAGRVILCALFIINISVLLCCIQYEYCKMIAEALKSNPYTWEITEKIISFLWDVTLAIVIIIISTAFIIIILEMTV